MKWVTRERPKADRIACPWLIRRFIDPQAEIRYVPADQVLAARSCIRSGTVFGLDYPVDAFDPGMSVRRTAPVHTIYSGHPAHRDDYLDGFYLQGSTQIDGLRHRRSDEVGFYGGTEDALIRPGTRGIGI